MLDFKDPRKAIAGITVIGLALVHVGFLAKGLKPPVAVDQGLIAALGAMFAPTGKKEADSGTA